MKSISCYDEQICSRALRKKTQNIYFVDYFFSGSIWMLTHGKLRVFKNLHFWIAQNVHLKVNMKIFFKNMPQKAILHRLCFSIQVNKLQKIPFVLRLFNLRNCFPFAQWLLLGIFVQKVFETNLNLRYHWVKYQKK